MPPWPKSVAAPKRLRRRYVIAALSNGEVALLVHMARAAGLPWDAILGADIFRHYKPAPEAYSSQVSVGRTGLLGDKTQ